MKNGIIPIIKDDFLSKYQFTLPLKFHCIGILLGSTGISKIIMTTGITNINKSLLLNLILHSPIFKLL